MKHYQYIVTLSMIFLGIFFIGLIGYTKNQIEYQNQAYHIEMNHIANQWQETGALPTDLSSYQYIEKVTLISFEEHTYNRLEGSPNTVFWGIYNEAGELECFLCFTYSLQRERMGLEILVGSIIFILLFLSGVFIYIYWALIKPISAMESLSEQLGKGNIASVRTVLPRKRFKKLRWGLKMLEDELEMTTKKNLTLQKQRQTLLTSIAHGIKTPVANIIMYTSAIQENLYPPEKFPQIISNIEENAGKINEHLSELLQTASHADYDIEIEKKEFYLDEWVKTIKSNYNETMTLQHIQFEIKSCPNCLIYSDPHALLNVASNILDNAIKYGDGMSIQMQIEVEEEMLYVTIENSGIPIPKSETNAIFKSFYRGSNTEKVQGNGLGLYICKMIIRGLDGNVYVLPKEKTDQFVFAVPIK